MMAINTNPSDPTATPDFDEWGFDSYWNADDWLTWLVALRDEYGRQIAADKFAAAWNGRTGWLESFGDVRAGWLVTNTAFRKELAKYELSNGINLLDSVQNSSPGSGLLGGAGDVVDAAGGGLTNVAGSVNSTTKTLKYLLPIVLIAITIMALVKFNIINLKNQ